MKPDKRCNYTQDKRAGKQILQEVSPTEHKQEGQNWENHHSFSADAQPRAGQGLSARCGAAAGGDLAAPCGHPASDSHKGEKGQSQRDEGAFPAQRPSIHHLHGMTEFRTP